ncbi:DUF1214 domain-containing protein [Tenacibaculum sp. UWU-22]|uniref:DUF1214 domain-containing protein n=1 Tax=Tenacibaculum sp. UWU-22 TaxID=3234187 RepID=UPI0034DB0A0C
MKRLISLFFIGLIALSGINAQGQNTSPSNQIPSYRITEYLQWYPAIKQAEMRDEWLTKYSYGEWQFSGAVTAKDRTVITPQSDVNYGYSWFNIADNPIVITMPKYQMYSSLSVFDMNHYMEVLISPDKPVVVRLPNQKNPIKDSYDIVINTIEGLAFTRHVIVNNESEVLNLVKNNQKITVGKSNKKFLIPSFTDKEAKAGLEIIKDYSLNIIKNARKLFGSEYEGVGMMDRCAGVFLGQLGTQAYVADYLQYLKDQNGDPLNGVDSYEIQVPAESLMADKNGYWSVTVYNIEDRYLIPNRKNVYNVNYYRTVKNKDGSVTVRINPKGEGDNAIPTNGKNFYGVFRVYNPKLGIVFPSIKKVD